MLHVPDFTFCLFMSKLAGTSNIQRLLIRNFGTQLVWVSVPGFLLLSWFVSSVLFSSPLQGGRSATCSLFLKDMQPWGSRLSLIILKEECQEQEQLYFSIFFLNRHTFQENRYIFFNNLTFFLFIHNASVSECGSFLTSSSLCFILLISALLLSLLEYSTFCN